MKIQTTSIDLDALELLLYLDAAFGKTRTYIEITRIPCQGEGYRPLTLLPQACDILPSNGEKPNAG